MYLVGTSRTQWVFRFRLNTRRLAHWFFPSANDLAVLVKPPQYPVASTWRCDQVASTPKDAANNESARPFIMVLALIFKCIVNKMSIKG